MNTFFKDLFGFTESAGISSFLPATAAGENEGAGTPPLSQTPAAAAFPHLHRSAEDPLLIDAAALFSADAPLVPDASSVAARAPPGGADLTSADPLARIGAGNAIPPFESSAVVDFIVPYTAGASLSGSSISSIASSSRLESDVGADIPPHALRCGTFLFPTVAQVRIAARNVLYRQARQYLAVEAQSGKASASPDSPPLSLLSLSLSHTVGDSRRLHRQYPNGFFQAASQFNGLEFPTPHGRPEDGIDIYRFDRTQGPACALACAAGTAYRNYLVPLVAQSPSGVDAGDTTAASGDTAGVSGGGGLFGLVQPRRRDRPESEEPSSGLSPQEGQSQMAQLNGLCDVERRLLRLPAWGRQPPWIVRNGYVDSRSRDPAALTSFAALLDADDATRCGLQDVVRVCLQLDTEVTDATLALAATAGMAASSVGAAKGDGSIDSTAVAAASRAAVAAAAADVRPTLSRSYTFASAPTLATSALSGSSFYTTILRRGRSTLRAAADSPQSRTAGTGGGRPQRLLVSQAYCSALSVGYSRIRDPRVWEATGRLALTAAYEATLFAGILHAERLWLSGRNGAKTDSGENGLASTTVPVLLTKLGGGVFANPPNWICDAINDATVALQRVAAEACAEAVRDHDAQQQLISGASASSKLAPVQVVAPLDASSNGIISLQLLLTHFGSVEDPYPELCHLRRAV